MKFSGGSAAPVREPRKPGTRWTGAQRDQVGVSFAFVTNQRGLSFSFHGGTKRAEIDRLCRYLDAVERAAADGGADLDAIALRLSRLERGERP